MGSVNTLDGKSPRLKRNEKIRENRSNKMLLLYCTIRLLEFSYKTMYC